MILPEIDWDKVAEKVARECDSALDVGEACAAVERATNRWLPEDLANCSELGGIEHKINHKLVLDRREYKGILDLWYIKVSGGVKIVDWKTVKTMDENWVRRQGLSKQGAWYGLLLLAARLVKASEALLVEVEYRGVHNPDAKPMKSVKQVLGMADLLELDRELNQWEYWFNRLDEDWQEPWPKNQPEGCRPFGPRYPCQFEDVCEGRTKYEYGGDTPHVNFSFSMLANLKRCPERLRLSKLTQIEQKTPVEKSESSSFGSAFHAGIEEVYLQTLMKGD